MKEIYSGLYPELRKICEEAGHSIMEIYKDESLFDIVSKEDNSPLTQADKASNAVICSGLQALDNEWPIISEENKEIPYEERRHFHRFWLVDPLDGTKEFVKRNGEFTVNIALVEGHRPVLGFVYVPVTGELYRAAKGEGAFLEVNGRELPLKSNEFSMSETGLKLVCSRSHLNEETNKFVEQFNDPILVSKGSSLKFLILASGEAHIYPRIAPTMEWDTGAAQIILEEAGGRVVRYDDDTPLVYNKENLLNPHFIAYGNLLKDD